MQNVRSEEKECPKLSDFGDFCRNETIDEYQVMVSCITASSTAYAGEDAVSAGVNTRIVVLTPCIVEFDVLYTTLKSCMKEIDVVYVTSIYRVKNAYLTRFLAAVVIYGSSLEIGISQLGRP